MAATKRNPMRIAEVREKIQTTQLINRLQDHILNDLDMSKSQVSAALGLLRKTLPDLSVQQLTGKDDGPIQLTTVERRIVDPKN